MIKNICIVGGGSAGWLTAAYLRNNIPDNVGITLIESSTIGTIGVGEGTQPYTMAFLRGCGLEPRDWMSVSDATYKYGVELTGWSKDPVFVDNDTQEMAVLGPGVMYHQYWLSNGCDTNQLAQDMPAYKLALANKSPKLNDQRLDYTPGFTTPTWDAVHFNAIALGDMLRTKFKNRIRYIDDVVTNIPTDDAGIVCLNTKSNGDIHADLFIDCTGFKSMLLEETLGVEFHSLKDTLLCDSAVAIPTQYKDKHTEMHPYTKSIAMESGWRWRIPTYSRIGNGYVFSSKHITPEEAEKRLREEIGEYEAPANHIKMKTGVHEHIAYKNVYAVGLAAGFVEPLEATGITFATRAVENLVDVLRFTNGEWNDAVCRELTVRYKLMVQEIVDFVFLHYYYAQKNDTPFWQDVHKLQPSKTAKRIIDMFVPKPPNVLTHDPYFNMFHVGQWFEMLYGLGAYDGIKGGASQDVVKYGDWVRESLNFRTDKLLEIMPNHYDYLRSFYE